MTNNLNFGKTNAATNGGSGGKTSSQRYESLRTDFNFMVCSSPKGAGYATGGLPASLTNPYSFFNLDYDQAYISTQLNAMPQE